jgi:hypothetical protein
MSAMKDLVQKYFDEGAAAAEAGVARTDCPYEAGTPEAFAWDWGWDFIEEERTLALEK